MLRRFIGRFSKAEHGGLSVETVLVVPLLFWALTATYVFWDAFKTINVSQKATYTIADMLSRETRAIDDSYLTAMQETFDFLAGSDGKNALRVTVVTKVEDPVTGQQSLQLVWSQGANGFQGYDDIVQIEPRVPDMAAGDQMIVVETMRNWSPFFSVGLGDFRFREVATARPRFAPQLVWDDGLV